jgi:uncharacterized protein (TIGR02246 family)
MRTPATVLVLILALAGKLPGQSRVADSIAVLHVIERRTEAMRAHDAHAERTVYAPDAVWINAFGRRRVGPDSIEAFLSRLYADPGYAASRLVREEVPEVWFIRPDVAVVHEYHEREAQRLADGSVIPIRRVHTTFVLSKENGGWLVRYQFIGDERERPKTLAP